MASDRFRPEEIARIRALLAAHPSDCGEKRLLGLISCCGMAMGGHCWHPFVSHHENLKWLWWLDDVLQWWPVQRMLWRMFNEHAH